MLRCAVFELQRAGSQEQRPRTHRQSSHRTLAGVEHNVSILGKPTIFGGVFACSECNFHSASFKLAHKAPLMHRHRSIGSQRARGAVEKWPPSGLRGPAWVGCEVISHLHMHALRTSFASTIEFAVSSHNRSASRSRQTATIATCLLAEHCNHRTVRG